MQTNILTVLATLSDADLIARVKSLVLRERDATAQLVAHLAVLETRDAYLREGYSSIFTYCRDALGLSESEACNRIEVARAARRFPVILEMLAAGEIHLWSVRLLSPHLTEENHREVLGWARGQKGTRAVQEIVARLAPRPDVPTVIRKIPGPPPAPAPPPEPPPAGRPLYSTDEPTPVAAAAVQPPLAAPYLGLPPASRALVTPLSPDRYKLQLTVSGDILEKLRCAKDLLSHAIPSGDDEAVLDRAMTALLVDLARKKFAHTDRPRRSSGCKDDTDISAAVKRFVYVRDRGRCTFVGTNGHRCEERRFIQFHHLDPKALGGKATPDRITLRCRRHNDYDGRLWFGKRRRSDGARVVKEDRATYGTALAATSNLLRNELRSGHQPPAAPCAFTNSEYSDVLPHMNRRLRWRPPKHTLAQRSGRSMRPIGRPSALNIDTPSRPASPMPQPIQRLPSTSTRRPSGVPGPASIRRRLLPRRVPRSTTS
jgi:hypothetical protein